MRGLRVQDTSPGRTCRRRRGVSDAPDIADLGAAPTSPPGGVCEHGFHLFPDLGRLASLDAPRAGSGGFTTYTTTPLELYCHRLRAEV
jgi:hypothetical protein